MRSTQLLRSTPKTVVSPLQYATSAVRLSDSDSFYPSFFYTSTARPAYLAIKAFNIELASIDDNVSNPVVGRMRYQWWRDAVKGAFEHKTSSHPVAKLLSTLPQLSHLSSYHFTRLINAREAHFLNPSFASLQDLADYSAGTQASLLYLLLQTVASPLALPAAGGQGNSSAAGKRKTSLPHSQPFEHTGFEHEFTSKAANGSLSNSANSALKAVDSLTLDHAASHLAVAVTISILLRSIPHHAAKRINLIPAEIALRHSLNEEDLFRNGPKAVGLRESIASLVGIANAELRTSRACFDGTRGVPAQALPVFLAATPARSWLDRLGSEDIGYNVFDGNLQKRYWKLPFQIWGDSRAGRY